MANEFKIKKGLIVTGADGGTVVDIQGSQGQLFSVTDDLSGSIFAVSDISGVPILDVNSSGLSTFDGNVVIGSVDSVVTGLNIGEASPTIQLFDTTNDGKLLMYMQDSSAVIGTYSNHALNLFSNSTLALTIDISQNATFAGDIDVTGDIDVGTRTWRSYTNTAAAINVEVSGGNAINIFNTQESAAFLNFIDSQSNGTQYANLNFNSSGTNALIINNMGYNTTISNAGVWTFPNELNATTYKGDLNGTINTATTGTTQTAGNNSTLIATTEYADAAAAAVPIGNYLPLAAGSGSPLTDTLYVQENGNKNNGTISMGLGGSGTTKWSFLAGTHYNQATGSGNGTGSAGMAIIGGLSTETYSKVFIGGGPYEINAATQIDFWTHSGTLSTQGGSQRGYVDNGGNWYLGNTLWVDAADDYVGIGTTTPGAKLDVQPTASNRKVTRIANDVMSTYFYNTQADAVLAWTCGSYYQAEVVITANQTNGGDYNNLYIRGIWSNNHTSHNWDELERVGFLTGSTFTMSVGQNGTITNSGRLELDFNYVSASFAQLNVRVTDFYGTHSYTIT